MVYMDNSDNTRELLKTASDCIADYNLKKAEICLLTAIAQNTASIADRLTDLVLHNIGGVKNG